MNNRPLSPEETRLAVERIKYEVTMRAYKDLVRALIKTKLGKLKNEHTAWAHHTLKDCISFFRSPWGQTMCDNRGEEIILKAYQQAEKYLK